MRSIIPTTLGAARRKALAFTILASATIGCDRSLPTSHTPDERQPDGNNTPTATPDRAQLERLAQRVARTMADPSFRRSLKAELDRSPVVEQKLHFQRFLHSADRQALRRIARLNREPASTIEADASTAATLEMYFPVPSHRAAWTGGEEILVATALTDRDAPVAFDVHGNRHVLSPDTPPATPVLAVVPAETDFDRPTPSQVVSCSAMRISAACASAPAPTAPKPATTGLYMTQVHLREEFESWLKGAPEIEILVLGQKGATDSLTKYQCIGQRASGSYYFDQNSIDWKGNVLLFSQTQLDNYRLQHPGQALRILFMEDDDTACELRASKASIEKLIGTVDGITRGLSGGRDSTTSLAQRVYKYALAAQKLYSVIASLINSNDDVIGNAVESATTGEFYAGYNWVLKSEGGATNGYINLLMR